MVNSLKCVIAALAARSRGAPFPVPVGRAFMVPLVLLRDRGRCPLSVVADYVKSQRRPG
nr:hypothetical protein [Rhodococcus sp. HNM0563]